MIEENIYKFQPLKESLTKSLQEKYTQLLNDIPVYNYDEVLNQLTLNLSLPFLRSNFYEIKVFLEYEKKIKDLRSQIIVVLSNELYSGLTKFENIDKVNNLSAILQDLGNICLKYSTTENLKFNLQMLIDTFLNSALGILNSELRE